MASFEMCVIVVTGYATVWALYLLLIPFAASSRRPRQQSTVRLADNGWPRIAVIVPARNVAGTIEGCLNALRACNYPIEKIDIYVVADHCSDDTAECAEAAGATVLTRNDGPKGKTNALAWAFIALTERGFTPDLYVISSMLMTERISAWRMGTI